MGPDRWQVTQLVSRIGTAENCFQFWSKHWYVGGHTARAEQPRQRQRHCARPKRNRKLQISDWGNYRCSKFQSRSWIIPQIRCFQSKILHSHLNVNCPTKRCSVNFPTAKNLWRGGLASYPHYDDATGLTGPQDCATLAHWSNAMHTFIWNFLHAIRHYCEIFHAENTSPPHSTCLSFGPVWKPIFSACHIPPCTSITTALRTRSRSR